MKSGFMSSVCPKQTLQQLTASAQQYGYTGIEFRVEWGHGHGIELDASSADLQNARRHLADAGIDASCVATSVKFNTNDPLDHESHQETLRRYIPLAAEIGAPCIRTFSDPLPEENEEARNEILKRAADSYAAVNDLAAERDVRVLVETHTNMRAHWAMQVLELAQASHLQVLWDPGHHVRRGQSVDEAHGHLQGSVAHLHFGTAGPGEGSMSEEEHARVVELLNADGFEGYFSVEVINPDDSDAVLAYNSRQFEKYLEAARAK